MTQERHYGSVALLWHKCQSISTFESEMRNSLSMLEPRSMDSLGHQHNAKKLSPKIAYHFKVLCISKEMLQLLKYEVSICLQHYSQIHNQIENSISDSYTYHHLQGEEIIIK